MATMKATSTIFFAILLSGLGHFVSCMQQPDELSPIQKFSKWLEGHETDLSFAMKDYVFRDLEKTTTKFQNLTIKFGAELGNPATGLNIAISETFDSYKEKKTCDKEKLIEIENGDPVGFNVYWRKFHAIRDFATCVEVFYATMRERIRLLHIKDRSDAAYKKVIDNSIATEYSRTPDSFVNQFLDLVGRTLKKEMIPVDRSGFDHEYEKRQFNDVQILKGIYYNEQTKELECHATCIYYKADSGKVYIYDSLGAPLEDKQIAFIQKRYPNCVTEHRKPSFMQYQESSCAVFAMTYATLLIKGKDPSKYKVRINKVHGDESLYMRLHIMEMLSINDLFLPKLIETE